MIKIKRFAFLALAALVLGACSSTVDRFSIIGKSEDQIAEMTARESTRAAPRQVSVAVAERSSGKGVVLLPIQGAGLSTTDRDQYRSALAQGLSNRYQVFSGDDVDKKLEKFAKKTCDAEKCLQEMAIAYQTSLIGRAVLSKEEEEYVITVEIRDAFTDQVEFTDTNTCSRCNKGQVISALKRVGRSIR